MHFIFSIYDRKSKAYMPPFPVRSFVEAERGFRQLLTDSKALPAVYPSEFELVHVASVDEVTGKIILDKGRPVSKEGDTFELLPHSFGLAFDFLQPTPVMAAPSNPTPRSSRRG